MTVVCARMRAAPDGSHAEIELAAAGHRAPIVLRADGRVQHVDCSGMAIGLSPDVRYQAAAVRLDLGDAMLMFSDGIDEAEGEDGFYGVARLTAFLPAYAGASPEVICEAVEQDVVEHLDGRSHDDIAILAITCGTIGHVSDVLARYEDAVASGDRAVTTALVDEMLSAGAQPVTVLTDAIAAAQRAAGVRWARGEWTVAHEHAATAMAVAATKTVMKHVRRVPATRGRLVVACPEREWHALPAMIIACALSARGWDTTLLGASTSALRLNQYIHDLGPEAVAVSCSMLGALPATRRLIEASTAAGVPVVVGGAAFGDDDVRARALGATAWARDAEGAVTAMEGLPAVVSPAPPLPEGTAGEQAALEIDHRRLFALLREQWSLTAAVLAAGEAPSAVALTEADDMLNQALYAVSAALLTGDPRPVAETSTWITDLIQNRGVDITQVRELRELLAAALGDYPQARELVVHHFADGPA